MSDITRVPVKIRKSIHKEYCSCHCIQVVSSLGEPQAAILNKDAILEDVMHYLGNCDVTLPVHVNGTAQSHLAEYLLGAGVPVVVHTTTVLQDSLMRELQSVPHSGIRVSIDFLDDLARKHLSGNSGDPSELRDMMYLAKSLKVSSYLHLRYAPHLLSKLSVFEIAEMFKSVCTHLSIEFVGWSDEQVQQLKPTWELVKHSSIDSFKKFYVADVPTRSWKVRDSYQREFLSDLHTFIKSKKLTLEVLSMSGWPLESRVRHSTAGFADYMFGHKPVVLRRSGEKFEVVKDAVEQPCESCGKNIFF